MPEHPCHLVPTTERMSTLTWMETCHDELSPVIQRVQLLVYCLSQASWHSYTFEMLVQPYGCRLCQTPAGSSILELLLSPDDMQNKFNFLLHHSWWDLTKHPQPSWIRDHRQTYGSIHHLCALCNLMCTLFLTCSVIWFTKVTVQICSHNSCRGRLNKNTMAFAGTSSVWVVLQEVIEGLQGPTVLSIHPCLCPRQLQMGFQLVLTFISERDYYKLQQRQLNLINVHPDE